MVDEARERIGDFTGADHPRTVQETFEPVFANLGISGNGEVTA